MKQPATESLTTLKCALVASRNDAQVAMVMELEDDFGALDVKAQGRFQRIMEMWCEGHGLTDKMFNANEGRSPDSKILIQAFKAFKIRLYGFVRNVRGKKTFIITEIDPAKKQDKADKKRLDRAKSKADAIGKGK